MMRGRRSVTTMKSESLLPSPSSVFTTSPSGIGKSPTLIDQQLTATITSRIPTETVIARVSSAADHIRRRTTRPRNGKCAVAPRLCRR